jgi:hypothetical protein
MVALAGSFVAGALMTWTIGVASSNTAKSEERLAVPAQPTIEQAAPTADCSTEVCDLQLG